MPELVRYDVAGSVGTLTLNRPERLNAMTADLLDSVLGALEVIAADPDVQVLVLTGAGRGFCVGGDLKAGLEGINGPAPLASQTRRLRNFMRTSELLHYMPQITIAAVNGPCAGAGLAWACACDLRYASTSAVFNTAFLDAAVSGDFGGTWTLPRIVGGGRARALYLTPSRVDAKEAELIGLVNSVFPDGSLLDEVNAIAHRLAQSAPLALRRIKENLNDADHLSFREHLEVEAHRHAYCCTTSDAKEAATAFMEKRQPVYQGS